MNGPGPFGESGRLHDIVGKTAERLAEQAADAKEAWLLKILKGLLPPEIFQLAESRRSRNRLKVAKWFAANQIRIEERAESTRVVRGEEVAGEFRVSFCKGRLVMEERLPKPKPGQN